MRMLISIALVTLAGLGSLIDVASAADPPPARRNAPPPALTLEAPRNLTVLRHTPHVLLGWTFEGEMTTGFEIERAILDGVPNVHPDRFTKIGAASRDARSFRDPTSHAGMTYVYRIRTIGVGTASPYSSEVIVKIHSAR